MFIFCILFTLFLFSFWYFGRHTKTAKYKGKYGEKMIAKLLSHYNQTLFNDYIIKDDNGITHQIDHILITHSGVFIIETKNYSGRIYGNETQTEWTQVLRYGRVKNKLYNPLKQNASHYYQIKKILPPEVPIRTCVVFVQGNIRFIDSDKVFTMKDLVLFINSFDKNVLSNSDITQIIEILNNHKCADISNKQHVKNIYCSMNNINNNICPRCGKQLIIRNGKNGQFYGCSDYPSCKFTKNI